MTSNKKNLLFSRKDLCYNPASDHYEKYSLPNQYFFPLCNSLSPIRSVAVPTTRHLPDYPVWYYGRPSIDPNIENLSYADHQKGSKESVVQLHYKLT